MDAIDRGAADSLAGKAIKAKGHIEDAVGGLTGDLGLQASGKLDQARGAAADVVGRVERKAGELGKATSAAATNARDRVQDAVDDADLRSVRESVERHTRANPLRSLLTAGAVGALIGWWLLPKHR